MVSSHNLDELERMCGSVVQLEAGRLVRHEALRGSSGTRSATEAGVAEASAGDGTSGEGQAGPERHGELTLELADVATEAFRSAVLDLDGVRSVRRSRRGDWRISTTDESGTAVALIALLHGEGWEWSRLVRGRSLEERLYGD